MSSKPDQAGCRGSAVVGRTLAALLLAGCGYSVGYQDFGPSRRTVSLQVVGNDTLRQRFEIPLTRALQEELPIHTNFRITSPGQADRVLAIDLADVTNRSMVGGGLGPGRTRLPVREGALEFAVRARLLDARTGQTLYETGVLDRAEYRIAVGETENSALAEASFDLARKIALALEDPF